MQGKFVQFKWKRSAVTLILTATILSVARSACVVTAPTWSKTPQAFVTLGSSSTVQVSDGTYPFVETGAECSVLIFDTWAEKEDGTKASANFVSIVNAAAPLNNIQVRLQPQTAGEDTTEMAVYVRAVDLATKAQSTFCFMYRASGTNDFCCPSDFDKTGCLSCAKSQFKPQNTASLDDIWNGSQGCAACDATKNYSAYLFTKANGDVVRGCRYVAAGTAQKEDDQCSFGSVLVKSTNPLGDSSLVCTACTSAIDSCPFCSTQSNCLKCKSSTQLVSLKDTSGSTYQICANNFAYGSTICTVANCLSCDSQDNPATKCSSCQGGYYLDTGTGTCVARTTDLTLDLFVKSYTGILMTGPELTAAQSNNGQSMQTPFYFIQQAIHKAYIGLEATKKLSVKVNVWLGKGDHFFFQCHESSNNYAGSTAVTHFCDSAQNLNLQAFYPPTDNVEFVFRPLICEYKTNTAYPFFQSVSDTDWTTYYQPYCIPTSTANPTPANGPTVYVMDNHSYFNVTRSMEFEQIEFRGDNALAYIAANPTFPINTLPQKLCNVVQADENLIDGSYTQIKLTRNTVAAIDSLGYVCGDQSFDSVSIPMQDFEACKVGADGTGLFATTNVNRMQPKCKFEPYRQEFWTKDTKVGDFHGIYFNRQQVLFNLYGFANNQQSAFAQRKVPQLKLTNCLFKFFLKDYDALINIESDNFVQITQASIKKPLLAKMGQDKGGRVNLVSSSFMHSRFCKGLISYKKPPVFKRSLFNGLYFVADAQGTPPIGYVSGSEPQILINSSTFTNLNLGKATQYLSHEGMGVLTLYDAEGIYENVNYPPFDNLGIVLNLQGYPGPVEVYKSTMKKNMVYIPDIFPSLRTSVYDFETNSMSALLDELQHYQDSQEQYSLKRCDHFRVSRLFSDALSSFKDHPDQALLQMERQSLIYISKPEQPVIIRSNTFKSNLGIFGGAVFVDSPNMQVNNAYKYDTPSPNLRPIVLVQENTFTGNSAYSAGNAVYLRGTRVRDTEQNELKQTCGGFHVLNNQFYNNTAVTKSHNGGAVVLACDYVQASDPRYSGATSNVEVGTAFANQTMQLPFFITNEQATVYRFSSSIMGNKFVNNTSGQKGTAAYTRHMQYLFVQNNVFSYNMPHLAFIESTYAYTFDSVYYTYLAKKARSISFYDEKKRPYNACRVKALKYGNGQMWCQADDEFDYMEYFATSADVDGLIDWPQVQGALHVEGCTSCLVSYYFEKEGCKFCHALPQYIEIKGNTFDRNQGGYSFYKESDMPKASQIFITGGQSSALISGNVFNNITQYIGNEAAALIEKKLPSYFKAMFAGYWTMLQSPLIHVEVPEQINYRFKDKTQPFSQSLADFHFDDNFVTNIASVQPLLKDQYYRGSLINFESSSIYSNMTLERNQVHDCFVIGEDASLIYMQGGTLNAMNNVFNRTGALTNATFMQPPTNFKQLFPVPPALDYTEPMQYAPYFAYPYFPNQTMNLTMDRGIFWIENGPMNNSLYFNTSNSLFAGNSFNYAFCHRGCIYTLDIAQNSHPYHISFHKNSYRNIYGLDAAIQMTQVEPQNSWKPLNVTTNLTYVILQYDLESLTNVQNGGYVVRGAHHEVMMIFRNVWFENVFGSRDSAAVQISNGASFYCQNCTFIQTVAPALRLNYTSIEYTQWRNQFVVWQFLRSKFTDFISQTTLTKFFGSGPASGEQIRLKGVNAKDRIIRPANITWPWKQKDPNQYLYNQWQNNCKLNPRDYSCSQIPWFHEPFENEIYKTFGVWGNQSYSIINDTHFEGYSTDRAVVTIDNSQVYMLKTRFKANKGTIGTNSATLVCNSANMTIDEAIFDENEASNGACIQAYNHSLIEIDYSVFYQNLAYQSGGMLDARDNCNIIVSNSVIQENESQNEGGVIAIHDNIDVQISFIDSNFTSNSGRNNIIALTNARMKLERTRFVNNFALVMTHGVYMYGSQLRAEGVLIYQAQNDYLNLKIQAGFFYLTAGSVLEIVKDSFVQHTYGSVAAVAYLDGDSFMLAQKTTFLDVLSLNAALLEGTGVIVASHASGISIDQCVFQNCDNTNVYASDTHVAVSNSVFKFGRRSSYLSVHYSQLSATGNEFIKATDSQAQGRAIKCVGCYNVAISNNKFSQLEGLHGGAVYFEATSNAILMSNWFFNNTAEQGGAIYIFYSDIQLRSNNFTQNLALTMQKQERSVGVQHLGQGGAVFFTCANLMDTDSYYRASPEYDIYGQYVDTKLYNNTKPKCQLEIARNYFVNNFAEAKGGALMYTNENITRSDKNLFLNNTSASGADVSSPPTGFSMVQWGSTGLRRDLQAGADLTEVSAAQQQVYTVVSGHEISVQFAIYNAEGLIAADDNTSSAEIVFKETPPYGFLKGNQAIAENGVFNFTHFFIQMQPGMQATLQLNILNFETYGNILPFIQNPIQITIYSRPCITGEMLTAQRTCVPCEPGTFSIKTNITDPSKCHRCPDHAICFGGADMTPAAGFVRVDETSVVFIRCLNDRACILPEKEEKLGKCDDHKGYTGYMCAECAQGYWRRENFYKCYKCLPGPAVSWIFAILAFIAFFIWTIMTFIRNFNAKHQMTIPIIRMMITYFQIYSILSGLEMFSGTKEINLFMNMIYIRSIVMTPVEQFFDFQCFHWMNLSREDTYYIMMVFQAVLPVIIFLVSLAWHWIAFTLRFCANYCKGDNRNRNSDSLSIGKVTERTFVSTSVVLYLVYPKMVELLLGSVHCFKALDDGPGDKVVYRLRYHPEITCDSKNYQWYRGFVFIPGVIVWVIIFPCFLIYNFVGKKIQIYSSQIGHDEEDTKLQEKQMAELVKAQYGFLFVGLKLEAPTKVTKEEEEQRALSKKEEDEFEKSQPNCFYRCLHCLSFTPLVIKRVFNVFRGKGIDIEPNKTLSAISYFYWEIIVYFGKFFLIIIVVFFTDINKEIQANMTLLVLATMLFLQLKNTPYERQVLNTMHITLLTTLLIVIYTRQMIYQFKISYDAWKQQQVVLGLEPITQEVATIARLFEFETNGMAYFYNAFIIIIIGFTFYIDLYFAYHLAIQGLLYFYVKSKRGSRIFQIITLKNNWINNKVKELHQKEMMFMTNESKNQKETEAEDNKEQNRSQQDTPSAQDNESRIESIGQEIIDPDDSKDDQVDKPKDFINIEEKHIKPQQLVTQPVESTQSRKFGQIIVCPEDVEFKKDEQRQMDFRISEEEDEDQDESPSNHLGKHNMLNGSWNHVETRRSNENLLQRLSSRSSSNENFVHKQGNLGASVDSSSQKSETKPIGNLPKQIRSKISSCDDESDQPSPSLAGKMIGREKSKDRSDSEMFAQQMVAKVRENKMRKLQSSSESEGENNESSESSVQQSKKRKQSVSDLPSSKKGIFDPKKSRSPDNPRAQRNVTAAAMIKRTMN